MEERLVIEVKVQHSWRELHTVVPKTCRNRWIGPPWDCAGWPGGCQVESGVIKGVLSSPKVCLMRAQTHSQRGQAQQLGGTGLARGCQFIHSVTVQHIGGEGRERGAINFTNTAIGSTEQWAAKHLLV